MPRSRKGQAQIRLRRIAFVVILDVAVELAHFYEDEAAVEKCCDVIGGEPDDLVVVPNGAVQLAFLIVDEATAEEGHVPIRVELDGLAKLLYGPVELAFFTISDTAFEEDSGISTRVFRVSIALILLLRQRQCRQRLPPDPVVPRHWLGRC